MPGLPPRGKAAATVQMNDDTLYGSAIVEAVDGKVTFSIPETDNYLAVQVVTERGHGQQYVVEDGVYNLPVESQYAFLIYRSGTENWHRRRESQFRQSRCDRL
jgi:predicted aminopeptidase